MSSSVMAQEISVRHVSLPDEFFEKPDPNAQVWNDLSDAVIPLLPQTITQPSLLKPTVPNLKVRFLHNGKWIAIRLQWDDATENLYVDTDQASDGCAVQFPVKDISKTSPFMGNKGAPVAIVHWKGIWQRDIEKGPQQVADLFPNTWYDTYRFGKDIAVEAGNPVSNQRRTLPVEDLMAEGFGTLTTQKQQDVNGWGMWSDGKWTVVLVRKMKSGDRHDPVLEPGSKTAVSFASWEGSAANVGARKNFSMWMPIVLEKK